jgi:predicted component of type VI protein secretion system
MRTLIVEVVDAQQHLRSEYVFERSPVRFGRSPLNDLPLDRAFVSHCHGVLNFDDARCDVVDLGSTNGTFVGERRLDKNQPFPLADGDAIVIGELTLSIRHVDAQRGQTRSSYAFHPSAINIQVPKDTLSTAPRDDDEAALAGLDALDAATMHEISALHARYRAAFRALMSAVARGTPPGANREQAASAWLSRFPDLAQEAEFRRWAGTATTPTPSQAPPSAQAAHLAAVLERLVQAFVELRRGQDQFARELSLPLVETTLPRADAATLVPFLTDSRHPERIDDLTRACADLMLHQIALVNAMAAGGRSLLAELNPSHVALSAGRGVLGWLGRLVGHDARFQAFKRRHEDLQEEGVLSSVLLGKAFVRAYTDAMGGKAATTEPSLPSRSTGPLDSTRPL